jgi:hypothetical protein
MRATVSPSIVERTDLNYGLRKVVYIQTWVNLQLGLGLAMFDLCGNGGDEFFSGAWLSFEPFPSTGKGWIGVPSAKLKHDGLFQRIQTRW